MESTSLVLLYNRRQNLDEAVLIAGDAYDCGELNDQNASSRDTAIHLAS